MKKFCLHTLLFLSPIVLLLLFLPVHDRYKYAGLSEDCAAHGLWMYQRIFEYQKPIHIAAIGSSHTISGLNDRLISNQLADQKIEFVNFGYCRLGRNLTYVLLKEVLQQKDIQQLIVEIREEEDRYSHPVFPHLGETKDVLFPTLLFNRDLVADWSEHFTYKVEVTQRFLYDPWPQFLDTKGAYGFGTTDDTLSTSEVLNVRRAKRSTVPADSWHSTFYRKFPLSYLQKIKALCVAEGIDLYFLYIPSFQIDYQLPNALAAYQELAPVLLPPDSIFTNPDNWHDPQHLNPAGAHKLSNWLADTLQIMITSESME